MGTTLSTDLRVWLLHGTLVSSVPGVSFDGAADRKLLDLGVVGSPLRATDPSDGHRRVRILHRRHGHREAEENEEGEEQ
ncbi:hypothetical protein BHE74_00021961 [Ensete ventricosum]|nr:hypothetical protein BHE74_00021961 [Ensete ventricosum]